MRSQFFGATSYHSYSVQIKSQCGCLGSGTGKQPTGHNQTCGTFVRGQLGVYEKMKTEIEVEERRRNDT